MSGVDRFKVGDRVVLARPNNDQKRDGLVAGMVGTVARADGDGIPKIAFDSGASDFASDRQLDPATPQRDDRRERIATAVLVGFAASLYTGEGPQSAARSAVEWADALIEELDK